MLLPWRSTQFYKASGTLIDLTSSFGWRADSHQDIHDKKFILLDTKNTEGTGVLLETLSGEKLKQIKTSSDSYFTHMELQNPWTDYTCTTDVVASSEKAPKKHLKVAHVDRHGNEEVDPCTYILLNHTYNIPFFKYKAMD